MGLIINPYFFAAGTPFTNTYSVNFDGVNDYAATGASISDLGITNKFTVSFWVKFDSFADWDGIAGSVSSGSFGDGFGCYARTDGKLYTFINNYTLGGLVTSSALSIGTWYHILWCYDGTLGSDNIEVFIDGSSIGTDDFTATVTTSGAGGTSTLNLGKVVAQYTFGGNLDEFAIWNTDKRANVTTIYNSGTPTDLSSLSPVAWYRMGDGDTYPMLNNEQVYSNRSVDFDGVNDYVTMGDVLDQDNDDAFSVSGWIKISVHSGTRYVISKWKGVNPFNGWGLYINTGHKLVFSLRGTSDIFAYSTASYLADVWYHVVGTYDGSGLASGLTVYVNGLDVTDTPNSGTLAGSISSDANFNISSRDNALYYPFPGNIDEVSFFDSELSAANVTTIYNSGTPNDISGLSPVGWWRMGEGDTYPMLNNGQAYSNRSVEFDGVDDYVDLGDSNDFSFGDGSTDSAFSVSAWVYPTTLGNFIIAAKSASGINEWNFYSYADNQFGIVLYDDSAGSYIGRKSATTQPINNWYHIVATYSGNGGSDGINIYVNGSIINLSNVQSGSYTAMENTTAPLKLGTFASLAWWATGNIDEVAIFDSELTSGNVTTIYNSGVPNDISGFSPVGWWRMGEGDTYPTLTDSGSGSNDGTMTNMVAGDIVGAQTTGIMTNQVAGDITGAETTGIMTNMVSGDIVEDVPS